MQMKLRASAHVTLETVQRSCDTLRGWRNSWRMELSYQRARVRTSWRNFVGEYLYLVGGEVLTDPFPVQRASFVQRLIIHDYFLDWA